MKTILDKMRDQIDSEKVSKIVTMTFRIDEETNKQFEMISKKMGISKNKVFIKLVKIAYADFEKKK